MSRTDDGSPGIFALEHLDWAGPDRLELRGTFTAAPPDGDAEPLLVVSGEDGLHELPRTGDSDVAPRVGEPWQAAFAWQEPPAAFTAAELVLGDVRIALDLQDDEDEPPAAPALDDDPVGLPALGGARVHLEAELLGARERIHELELELERARVETDRAREDLGAELAGREQDAARFRDALATVERAAAVELEEARASVEAAEAARTQVDVLRAELEQADVRHAQLRERLLAASDDLERALGRLRGAELEPDGTDGRQ